MTRLTNEQNLVLNWVESENLAALKVFSKAYPDFNFDFEDPDCGGRTPYMISQQKEFRQIKKFLKDHGALTELTAEQKLVYNWVEQANLEELEAFSKTHPAFSFDFRNYKKDGFTLLHCVARHKNKQDFQEATKRVKIARFLIDKGLNPAKVAIGNEEALFYSVLSSNREMSELFIDAGCSMHHKDIADCTLDFLCCLRGQSELVKVLDKRETDRIMGRVTQKTLNVTQRVRKMKESQKTS